MNTSHAIKKDIKIIEMTVWKIAEIITMIMIMLKDMMTVETIEWMIAEMTIEDMATTIKSLA